MEIKMKLLDAVLVAVAVTSSGTEAAPLSGTTYTDEGYSNSFEVVKLSDQPTGGTSRPFGPPAESAVASELLRKIRSANEISQDAPRELTDKEKAIIKNHLTRA